MTQQSHRHAHARRNHGFSLIELMIALVLGLVVTGGAISLMLANRQSYRTNEGLSQVQESARSAFEMLARDIRQAGSNGCDSNNGRMANVLDDTAPFWWQTWFVMRGYESTQTDPAVTVGTATLEKAAGTDSIQVQGIRGLGLSIESHNPTSAEFKISSATTDFVSNDILIVCDIDHATIFQVSTYNDSNVTVTHNTGAGPPANCSKGLGYPTICPDTNGNVYAFGPNSQIARFDAADWYIGNNGRADEGGRSLYRRGLGSGATALTEEMVSGITDMQIQYRLQSSTSFVDASDASLTAATWTDVNAVMITLTMVSADRSVSTDLGVNTGRISRSFTQIITLRNRAS